MAQVYAYVAEHFFSLLGWVIAAAAFVLVPFRRPAAEARSWLLIFFILPWGALAIYWLIGRPQHARARRERFADLPEMFRQIISGRAIISDHGPPRLDGGDATVASLAKGMGTLPPVGQNSVELISDYATLYDQLIADIDTARDHVHLEFYIFYFDAVGERVMTALEGAVQRGVICRVLIDALGSFATGARIIRRLRKSGVEVHAVLPLRRRWNSSRLDLRNHRKIVIVDEKTGYTGSQNIWDPAAHSRRSNQELSVRVTGPVVVELQAVFIADWYLETGVKLLEDRLSPALPGTGHEIMQIFPSGPDYPAGGVDLIFVQAMYNAMREIVIVTPYFIPNDALISAIKSAVLRGVKVRLIFTRKSDHRLVGLAQRSYYTELLIAGAEIYLFGPDFLHAKHFRVDQDLSIIGSSNMDLRSFELNAEMDLICFGADVTWGLRDLEAQYLTQSEQLILSEWQQRPLVLKTLENSARLISDLI